MALTNYAKRLGGEGAPINTMDANKANKALLLQDQKRMQEGKLGLSGSEKRQLVDSSVQQAGAGIEAVNQDLAQQGLSSGGAGPSARYAMLQRDLSSGVANTASQANAEAERISQAKALSEKQDIIARTERQQAVQTQKAQFWGQLLLSNVGSALKVGGSASVNASA